MEILTKENLVGAKVAPKSCRFSSDFHSLTKGNSGPSFGKDLLLPPRIRRKIVRRWGWGSNRDPEYQSPTRCQQKNVRPANLWLRVS